MLDGERDALSRRHFLSISAAAAAAAAMTGVATNPSVVSATQMAARSGNADLLDPPTLYSQSGSLNANFAAALAPTVVAGKPVSARVYNGSFPGPTLRVRGGDTVRLRLANQLNTVTNLHMHGLHVSPGGNSDNIFVHVMPGDAFDYEYHVPIDHPAGLYWYHPHGHGTSNQQVNNGMAGAVIIEGALDRLPSIAGLKERLLVLQATEFGDDGVVLPTGKQTNDGWLRLVNGQTNPTIRMQPGETQRWRILNASSGTFFNIGLAGHRIHQIAKDGNTLSRPWTRDAIVLSPGERIEVLVQAAPAGTYELRTMLFGQGFQAMRDVVLATLVIDGAAVAPIPLPKTLLPLKDLRNHAVARKRKIIFDTNPGPPTTEATHYMIDGRPFDPLRVDASVQLGTTEEWTLVNTTDEWHPFHIHVNPFQVVAVDGVSVKPRYFEDTINIPPGGSIKVRTQFLDYTGKYVYHCHLLFHEDDGMMGVVQVNPKPAPRAAPRPTGTPAPPAP